MARQNMPTPRRALMVIRMRFAFNSRVRSNYLSSPLWWLILDRRNAQFPKGHFSCDRRDNMFVGQTTNKPEGGHEQEFPICFLTDGSALSCKHFFSFASFIFSFRPPPSFLSSASSHLLSFFMPRPLPLASLLPVSR